MGELAGQDDPLLIASRKRERARIQRQGRKLEPGGAALHIRDKPRPIEGQPAAIAPAAAENQILSHRQARDQRQGQRVVGDAGDPALANPRDRPAVRGLAQETHDAAAGRRRPRTSSASSRWPLPETPADSENFASADAKRKIAAAPTRRARAPWRRLRTRAPRRRPRRAGGPRLCRRSAEPRRTSSEAGRPRSPPALASLRRRGPGA